jgi:hypothetical protein
VTAIEKAFWILFLLILVAWAFAWMVDDWRNDDRKD